MSQQYPIIIPASAGANPGVFRANVTGKFYAVIDANGVFKIRVDNGSEIESKIGHYFGDDISAEFSRITFYNYSGVAIAVTFYAGMVFYKPTTSSTIANASISVAGKNSPTYTKGTNGLIFSTGTQNFTGLDGAALRKSFSVFNTHAADVLNIRGANGVLMHVCDPRTGFVVESGESITLHVPGANTITPAVCEVFYSP